MDLSKLSLSFRLLIAFIALAIVGLTGNAVAISSISTLDDDIDNLVSDSMVRLDMISNINDAVLTANFAQERWKNVQLSDELYEAQFSVMSNARKKADDAFDIFGKYAKPPAAQKAYEALEENTRKILDEIDVKLINYARQCQNSPDRAKLVSLAAIDLGRPQYVAKETGLLVDMRGFVEARITGDKTRSSKNAKRALSTSTVTAVVMIIVAVCFCILFPRSITNAVKNISIGLRNETSQVTSHAKELAAGSQSLASGASEQAAAAESIASSIEEIASMVRQNAENTSEASKLVAEAKMSVDATQKYMERSLKANEEISAASGETSKIIKSIDEIAFQTNLLSLNAAVEAARAGEAGAGFAVVASEVRGLSQRSAEAAKHTSEKIEQTIEKVKEGVDIFKETGKNINEVVDHVYKVAQLVDDVAAASGEQSKGLSQINVSIADMEKVIQQNAAHAEESAASTTELHSQAQTILEHIELLEEYFFGAKKV